MGQRNNTFALLRRNSSARIRKDVNYKRNLPDAKTIFETRRVASMHAFVVFTFSFLGKVFVTFIDYSLNCTFTEFILKQFSLSRFP